MATLTHERADHEVVLCGRTVHGFHCDLPKGHNMGRADIPDNHRPRDVKGKVEEAVEAWYSANYPAMEVA